MTRPAASTGRRAIVAALDAALASAGVNVIGYAQNIAPPSRRTVMVRIDNLRPATVRTQRVYVAALVLIPSTDDPTGPADDELDELLDDVLDALDRAEDLTWSSADRATYQGTTYPAYEVRLEQFTTTTGNTPPEETETNA